MAPKAADSRNVAASEEHFRFAVPGRLEYRDAARAFLTELCTRIVRTRNLPSDLAPQIISAFVEAFNNAVIHAYQGRDPGPVEVGLKINDVELEVRVTDYGSTFALDEVPEPDLDALPEGGLGLFIIRSFMDHVQYERAGDRNILIMTKKWPSEGED